MQLDQKDQKRVRYRPTLRPYWKMQRCSLNMLEHSLENSGNLWNWSRSIWSVLSLLAMHLAWMHRLNMGHGSSMFLMRLTCDAMRFVFKSFDWRMLAGSQLTACPGLDDVTQQGCVPRFGASRWDYVPLWGALHRKWSQGQGQGMSGSGQLDAVGGCWMQLDKVVYHCIHYYRITCSCHQLS